MSSADKKSPPHAPEPLSTDKPAPEISDHDVDLDPDLRHAFRPAKKRKVFRARQHSPPAPSADSEPHPVVSSAAPAIEPDEASTDAARDSDALAAIRRRQQAAKQRQRKGIEFGSGSAEGMAGMATTMATTAAEAHGEMPNGASVAEGRFAPQMGHAAAVDRHMMAYIDAELARRQPASRGREAARGEEQMQEQQATERHEDDDADGDGDASEHPRAHGSRAPQDAAHPQLPARQPATLGKIQEVTLPALSSSGGVGGGSSSIGGKRERPPRIRRGRDGRPLPPRRRPRRGSADLARDALVESLMHEPVDGPDAHGHQQSARGGGPLQAAGFQGFDRSDAQELLTDDMLAERFRREWADTQAARDQKREGREKDKGKEEERLKGPKLGGSRSQRMAVREKELEAQREREKGKKR